MDLNYILNSPLDQNTTEEANAQQTNEILDLLYKTVQPKLAGKGKTVYKIKDDKIQLQTETDKINIQINKREMDFPSVEDIIELNKEAQSLFEEEGIYGVAGLKDRELLRRPLIILEKIQLFLAKINFQLYRVKQPIYGLNWHVIKRSIMEINVQVY